MISASERVILRRALEDGFVSAKQLSGSQIKIARQLLDRGLLRTAGAEPDGSAVYGPTEQARNNAGWL